MDSSTSWTRVGVALALCAVVACTSKKNSEPGSGSATASPARSPQRPAPPAPAPAPLGPATSALLDAAVAVGDDSAVEAWLQGTSTLADAPPSVAVALAALRAWEPSRESIAIPEMGEDSRRAMSLFRLGRVVSKGATAAPAAVPTAVIELLGVAQALRAPGNFSITQVTGFGIATELYSALRRADAEAGRTEAPSAALRALAPTDAEALACAKGMVSAAVALARHVTWESVELEAAQAGGSAAGSAAAADTDDELSHTVAQVERYRRDAKLPLGEGWLRADYDAYAAFWDETERLTAAATDVRSVGRVAAERLAAANAHPTSMLVRLLGPMVLSERIPKVAEDLDSHVASVRADLSR